MNKIMVSLNSFEKVKAFVEMAYSLECSLKLISGSYVVDGQSILAIFALDLSRAIEVNIQEAGNRTCLIPKELEEFRV